MSVDQYLERAMFICTIILLCLTIIGVGVVLFHLTNNVVTVEDLDKALAASEARIISALREEMQETKDEVHDLRSETNNKVLNHVTTLHAKNQ